MSECRALTNVIGNGVATLVMARWEGTLDRTRLAEELRRGPTENAPAVRSGAATSSWPTSRISANWSMNHGSMPVDSATSLTLAPARSAASIA